MGDSSPFRSAEARSRYLAAYDAWSASWPLSAEGWMLSTRYGSTFARGSGPLDAPVVVLLPGARATSLMWAANVAALAATHRVWALDSIADFGRSVPSRPVHTPEDFVIWLDEVSATLSPGRPFGLAGASYGGWIAAQYALARPARISALALIAPAGTVISPRAGFLARALLSMLPARYFARSFMRWLLHELATKDAASRALLEQRIDQVYLAARSFQRRLPIAPTILSDDELRRLPVRTLFIAGSEDRMFDVAAATERLRRATPGVRIELVARAGHDVTTARADLVNERLVALFDGPGRAQAG